MLRFCDKCLLTVEAQAHERCRKCAVELKPFLDQNGAISREFLLSRGTCCDNGCSNCPYSKNAVTITNGSQKICPRCGNSFGCSNETCWCGNLQMDPNVLEKLKQDFVGCLCPKCLEDSAVDLRR